MDLYTSEDAPRVRTTLVERVQRGEVGILPTDTIYGLSGDATDEGVVGRILRLKRRRRPCSIIPHDLEWARLAVDAPAAVFDDAFERFIGAFTVLWRFSGRVALPRALVSAGVIGLRFPRHWIGELAVAVGRPLVSTSVNRTRRPYMTSLDDLDATVAAGVSFVVWEGQRAGPPSTLVHATRGFALQPRAVAGAPR